MRFPCCLLFSLLLPLLCVAEEHWSYVLPRKPEIATGSHPVDALLTQAQEKAGLTPAPLAPPRQWAIRAAYTLTGLPPTAEQIDRLEKDPSEENWRKLIDEWLASPAYGERWARHWMDVARYADTSGYAFEQDNRYPYAFTYRDWLIQAFQDDMPYDRFVQLQIAADLLVDRPDHPDLAALGLLTVGPRSGALETVDDRVDVVTRGFLGSTVSCARCHKHKSDPITMNDYYSMYSIFENIEEPGERPVIGKASDARAQAEFEREIGQWQARDQAARQAVVDHMRQPQAVAVYLELAWQAQKESWDQPRATSESFKRGRYRADAVMRWRDFLRGKAWQERRSPRLAQWADAMEKADAARRKELCTQLAAEWTQAEAGSELAKLREQRDCVLNYDVHRISQLFDREDDTRNRERLSALSKLQADHPGSPPRAMSVQDRKKWSQAQIYLRGNPATKGEVIERSWLSFLGGGVYPATQSPRLSLAQKITGPANPLVDRVWVNRVWAWHFGQPLTEPSDFGYQQEAPALQKLLDFLAVDFRQNGSSLKQLHRLLLTSHAFRREAHGAEKNAAIDEANQLFWKWNRQRVDFESMRDRLLLTAGSLQLDRIGGKPGALENPAMDQRRSLYGFIDRYALPGTLVTFDLPHPDHHSAKRVETTVPQQALYFLNGAMVQRQAQRLAQDPALLACGDDEARIRWIYQRLLQRAPQTRELNAARAWIQQADAAEYDAPLSGQWEIVYALESSAEIKTFPLFHQNVWKTGEDLAKAPVPWLSASASGGHPSQGYELILRWRAMGAGQVRMLGKLHKPTKEGDVLAWEIRDPARQTLRSGDLAPRQSSALESPWVTVAEGATIDFVLRAPRGHNHGSTDWDLRIEGRDTASSVVREISRLAEDFPTPQRKSAAPVKGSPWVDLIQMLWASNEFHFID